jgi:hypothetical protein
MFFLSKHSPPTIRSVIPKLRIRANMVSYPTSGCSDKTPPICSPIVRRSTVTAKVCRYGIYINFSYHWRILQAKEFPFRFTQDLDQGTTPGLNQELNEVRDQAQDPVPDMASAQLQDLDLPHAVFLIIFLSSNTMICNLLFLCPKT